MIRHRSLLALTPDLSRTGAPRLLLSLLAELEREGAIDPVRTRVLAGSDGPLAPEVESVASLRILGPGSALPGRAVRRIRPDLSAVGDRVGVAASILSQPLGRSGGPPDLVWANGAGALRMAAALPRAARRAPLVAHIHELDVGLRRSLAGDDPLTLLQRARAIVAVSGPVRDHLVERVGVDPARVVVHHGWVPSLGGESRGSRAALRPDEVPPHALVVGGCGAVGWRKGTDLFLELARRLPDEVGGRPVHLVWVGGEARPGDLGRAARDVALRGLGERVHLVGEVADAGPWIAGFDLLALTSREDPFPLVVLEAGALGVPVVGFRSGGIIEAIPEDDHSVCLVELFDLDGLATKVGVLLAEPEARQALAAALAMRVRTRHAPESSVRALWAEVAGRLARG